MSINVYIECGVKCQTWQRIYIYIRSSVYL